MFNYATHDFYFYFQMVSQYVCSLHHWNPFPLSTLKALKWTILYRVHWKNEQQFEITKYEIDVSDTLCHKRVFIRLKIKSNWDTWKLHWFLGQTKLNSAFQNTIVVNFTYFLVNLTTCPLYALLFVFQWHNQVLSLF